MYFEMLRCEKKANELFSLDIDANNYFRVIKSALIDS